MTHNSKGGGIKRNILLLITALGLLFVAGLAALFYWGMDIFTEQAKTALEGQPVIQEHIGEIESIEIDYVATGGHEDENVFVFDLVGSKGKGVVTAEFFTVSDEVEELGAGTLRIPSGEVFPFYEEDGPGAGTGAAPETPESGAEPGVESP